MSTVETLSKQRSNAVLTSLAAVQLALWVALAAHPATSDVRGVFGYLALIGLLFAAYGASLALLAPTGRDSPDGATSSQAQNNNSIRAVLAAALLFRLVQILAGLPQEERWDAVQRDLSGTETGYETFLLFDNDAWRYLWDGAVLAGGASPYAAPPLELESEYLELDEPRNEREELLFQLFEETLWVEIYDNLSFTAYRTVYGPAAQSFFAASNSLRPGSMLVFKALLTAAEFAGCLLLLKLAARRRTFVLLAYSWNPLVIKEIAGSGHIDGLLVTLLLGSVVALERGHGAVSGAFAALATAVKISAAPLAAVLFVFAWTRSGRRAALRLATAFAAGSLALFAPYRDDLPAIFDALAVFAREWMFNPGPWLAVRRLGEALGLDGWSVANGFGALCLAAALGTSALVARKTEGPAALFAALLATTLSIVWFSATVNPWYLVWSLPFAALLGWWPLIVLCCTSQLSYVFYLDQIERIWLLVLEHGLFGLACAVWWLLERRR
ncbi:MAG: glycosyltransferase 87 family protein [Acidobacteriota bacterium]